MNKKFKSTDYTDLRNKTVFDYSDDAKLLESITLFPKDEYQSLLTARRNAFDLLELAEALGDDDLTKAVEKEFQKEFDEFFNE